MSLETAAKRLAAKGRKGDTLLVHMHPKEVAGLQALAERHGTSMTLNPSTGLPEAFSLKSILPMIAGAVGGFYGGPWGGAAASAAMTKLEGGSNQSALMSGVGSYFGAGNMGDAAAQVGTEGAAGVAGEGLAGTAAETAGEGAVQVAGPGTELMQNPETGEMFNPAGSATTVPQAPVVAPETAMPQQLAGPRDTTLGQDFNAWKDKMGGTQGLGKAGLGVLMQAGAVDPTKPDPQKIKMGIQKYSYDPRYQNTPITDSRERTQFGNQFTKGAYQDVSQYMAAGGIARLAKGGTPPPASTTGGYRPEQVYGAGQSGGYDPRTVYGAGATMPTLGAPQGSAPAVAATAADATQKYTYDPASAGFSINSAWQAAQDAQQQQQQALQIMPPDYYEGQAAKRGGAIHAAKGGGISSLGAYSDGGQLLRGPGNGTSDSIPATIDGNRPARLASGEFVVPARIVSELGNGSTEAGSKELYGMLDRIQRARAKTVGKNKVAHDAKARNMLPA